MRIIAGEWGGRVIRAPAGRGTRPTADRIREAWMASLGDRLEGASVLDLFAGSGALGLEALSRGSIEAVFVEKSRRALQALRKNIELLGAGDRSSIVESNAFQYLERLSSPALPDAPGPPADDAREPPPEPPGEPLPDREFPFDIALADPPYDRGFAGRLLEAFAAAPFARELWVEHRTREELPDLPGLRQRRYSDTTISIVEMA